MVGRALQVDPERGARFYAGYGERTGLMWMEFLGILEANLSNSEEAEAAVLGAQKTFERLDAWLNQS